MSDAELGLSIAEQLARNFAPAGAFAVLAMFLAIPLANWWQARQRRNRRVLRFRWPRREPQNQTHQRR